MAEGGSDAPPPEDPQRPQAEAALRAIERVYRSIVENAVEGIWTIDAQALTTFVNPAMARMLGHRPEDMLGRPLTAFMDAQGAALAEANLERRRQGVAEQHEFRFLRRDGGEVWALLSTNPILDDAGRYTGALAMVIDITERRRVEQQLKLLASSVARFNDIVIITEAEPQDEPGPRILFVNEAFERRTGYRREEVLGRTPRLLQGPKTDRAELDRIREALRRWQPVRSQLLNYDRQGGEFWLELDIVPIADDKGWFTHWVAVEHDISERKRNEARDASRERVMSLIAGGAPLPAVLEATVRGVEASHPAMLCSVMQLDGSLSHLLPAAAPSLPRFYVEAMDRLAVGSDGGCCGYAAWSKARTVVADIRVDPRWATYRELAARAGLTACWSEPILSQGGAVLGTFGVYHRQVHEPSEIELATVTEAAKLAGIAIERKRADDALRESQKMEALGTLAGGIAHDFNNILGAILGNVALARSEAGAEGQTHLDHIQRSAVRARHLVQQILAFGRRQPRQACAQPLRPLVEEAVGLLRSTLPAGLRLLTRLPAGEVCALADATQIQQLLLNLCTNAWHAIGDGPGEIEVGLEALAEAGPEAVQARLAPGPVAHLWVRDSGKGMDEATRTRIFEPFFTTKPVGVGTGLGLAVVHGIVSEHRGTVTVESAPGRGATFHIYLPATAAAPADAASSALPPAAAAEPDRSAAARRILLVDDDEVMRLTGAGLLECHGHQVTTAAGAREALEAVRRARGAFDLVVCDYNMPESSGVEVARELARIEAGLPVVIYSGYIDAELRARAGEVGVVALLHKENAAEELEPTVRRVLARRDG